MKDTAQNQSVVIMAGMHRSGSSLTASLLQNAGIYIGDRLMGATEANPKGYFEDWDFVDFHANVLRSQGIADEGWTKENQIKVQQQYMLTARNLILGRKEHSIWGWKDPRTTLFLDFWARLIPDAKYIFVYRSPWEVVDSLFRRGDVIFRTNPNFAVQQWCNYNQAVLNFYQQHQERSFLIGIESIIQNSDGFIDLVKQKFSLKLRSPESLYEPALFNANSNIHYRQALITEFFPEAIDLYAQLQQADKSSSAPVAHQSIDLTCKSWILQDWSDLKGTTREKGNLETELTETHQKLHSAQVEQAQVQHQLNLNTEQLTETQQQLQATQTELTETHQKLHSAQVEQAQAQHQLNLTTEQLTETQQQLQSTQLELTETQQQLQSAQVEQVQAQHQLNLTTEQLTETQQQLQSAQVEQVQAQHQLNLTTEQLTETQQQLQSTQLELTETQQQLQSAQVEQVQAQHQLNLTTEQLTETQQQLQSTQPELEQAKIIEVQVVRQQVEEQLNQAQKQLQISQMQAEQFKSLVVAMESSKFWKLRRLWFDWKQKTNLGATDIVYQNYLFSLNKAAQIPTAVANVNVNVNTDIPISGDPKYQVWLERNYPGHNELKKIKEKSLALAYKPLISVIVPVYNPEEKFLRQAIASVIEQAYSNWELCLADDCSTKPYVRSILEEYAAQDERIKVVFRSENGHICHTSNSALEIATGEYIALLDHDDLLPPHALARVAELLNEHPEADFIYSDEDKIDDNHIYQSPFFKPDWCPDSFLARMYTCHLGVYRRSLVQSVGNFRVGFEGSQDYDLVLRITEKTNNIFHIPDILYHWRIHLQSTASDSNAKPYAADAAKKAIAEAIERRGEPGKIKTQVSFPGVYQVRYQIKEQKLVSIIIPTKDLADTLDVCLKSIFAQTTYSNYEVVVIDNNSTEAKTAQCLADWQKQQPQRFRSIPYHVPFNYSQINNYAVQQVKGDYLLFLNNDIEVITKGWLTAMVEQAQRKSIGAVGSLLLYPDDTIQHAGVVVGLGGVAGHSHKHLHISQPGYMFQVVSTNNYSAVTGACLMCRREVFAEVQGFEEDLAIAFNDVDFCLKIAKLGYNNIYLPHVVLYHYESKSRGYENTPEKQARFAKEVNYMKQKWQKVCLHDPCYSPNLTKDYENYSINV
ncbi:glycosyltransferase [Pleurocapsa sp. FMAR1]|uniref:glycosyltransferase n=1 Tax=Pleurocapsa sp. FMAR1 TaxID=3040204 RepID=UPI0029C7854E|nr:glycosyltransferase [Pleurocapsa sp. FMAR1]